MGGQIRVESEEGIGTAIHFTINTAISKTKNDLSSDNLVLPVSQRTDEIKQEKHILVCEDNPVNSMLVVSLLKKLGHKVTAVDNGEKAIDKLNKEDFDLILMDCQMPVMDGFETTTFIRQSNDVLNPEIPIVALTANASKEDM